MAGDESHAGLLEDFNAPGADGADCHGGIVNLLYPDGRVGIVPCPRCRRERVQSALASFVPPRFRREIPVPDAVAEWAQGRGGTDGLYLAGQVGTGKTHAAWMAVRLWCKAAGVIPHDGIVSPHTDRRSAPSVIFARMTDLLDDFRPGDDSVSRVRACQNARLLVIDDLGAERPSEWTQERLYSVIDHRYANCLPLVVTGNLPPGPLAKQTGDRVASRLAEMCAVVPMTGDDRRRPAA